MRYIFVIFSFTFFYFDLYADPIEEKVKNVIEDTKQAGTAELPVSIKSQHKLDSAKNASNRDNESKENKYKKAKISFDCQSWQSFESLESKNKDQFELRKIFYKDEGDSIGKVDEKNQTILLIYKGSASYFQITKGAIIGLFGKRGIIYRPIKSEKIHLDLVGILQSLALLGAEFTDQWHFSLTRTGRPQLLFNLSDFKSDKTVGKYLALHCTIDKGCRLLGKSGTRPTPLVVDSKEHLLLKAKDLFSNGRLTALRSLCKKILSSEFKNDFSAELSALKNTCPNHLVNEEPNFSELSKACDDLHTKLAPTLQHFQ